jgi:RnfABCDGE-type electron transport complex B subunit
MASGPLDNELEFYSIVVPEGAFSPRLAALKPGDTLYVEKNPYGFLTIDRFAAPGTSMSGAAECSEYSDLWLLASGTGLSAYLSILRDVRTWTTFRRIILVHGVRYAHEFAYQQEIQGWSSVPEFAEIHRADPRKLIYLAVTTREPLSGTPQERLTTLIADGRLETLVGEKLDPAHAKVMLCGNPDMLADARKLLGVRGFLPGRRGALLPQTQCTKCGYDGCRPYATAIAAGDVDINRCPPGGEDGVHALAALLDRAAPALDRSRGEPGPLRVAVIDETHCIGCTLCIDACPVDAIVGTAKRMHTVLDDLCSGCDLCIAPCPVDCIAMVPTERTWTADDAHRARDRHQHRAYRLQQIANAGAGTGAGTRRAGARLAASANAATDPPTGLTTNNLSDPPSRVDTMHKRATIENALARARARRGISP